MQIRETRLRNFIVIQMFAEGASGFENLLDIKVEPNFNIVRRSASHAETDPGPKRVVVYLTPPKPFNKNIYVVIYGTQDPGGACLKFTIDSRGILVEPTNVLFLAHTPEEAYGQLLMSNKSDGAEVFGVPIGHGLPGLLAVQFMLGEKQVKFLVGVGEDDIAVDPVPFKNLLAALKRPPGPLKKRTKAKVISMIPRKT